MYKNLFFFVFLASFGAVLAQPIGGDMHFLLLHKEDTITFKTQSKESIWSQKKLKSKDGNFKITSSSSFNNFRAYQHSPYFSRDIDSYSESQFTIYIENKAKEKMSIDFIEFPDRSFVFKIPFQKGNFRLKFFDETMSNPIKKLNEMDHFLSYTTIGGKFDFRGIDLRNIDWEKHKVTDNAHDDVIWKVDCPFKKVDISGDYMVVPKRKDSCAGYAASIDKDKLWITKETGLCKQQENQYSKIYFEYYFNLAENVENIFNVQTDSIHYLRASEADEYIYDNEPIPYNDGEPKPSQWRRSGTGIITTSFGGNLFNKKTILKTPDEENYLYKLIDSFKTKRKYNGEVYEITDLFSIATRRDDTLKLDYQSKVTGAVIKLPFNSRMYYNNWKSDQSIDDSNVATLTVNKDTLVLKTFLSELKELYFIKE